MNPIEQGHRLAVRKKENYQKLLETEGWGQLRKHLEGLYHVSLKEFLNGGDPNASRHTMTAIEGIFNEVGFSFDRAEQAKKELEKLLNRKA